MLTKIGIVTHYYRSTNYGGVLQSYALCKYLNQNGFDARQICYNTTKYPLSFRIKHFLAFHYMQLKNLLHPKALINILRRKKSFASFRESVPHTDEVFSDKTLYKANELFDAFVTGSDQVWHPAVINKGYSLSFCSKPKYSFAASIASDVIPGEKNRFYASIKTFNAVSVRERRAQELLSVPSQLVLDPVFLLPHEHWKSLASPVKVKEAYVFCYFLGDSLEERKAAVRFAHDKNLKAVNIPYLRDRYRKCDDGLFDYSLSSVTPNDFLSLILNAEYVFTDSFHAICFSYLFKKQFFVFDRKSKAAMNTRIKDILYTLDLTNRFVDISENRLSAYSEIDYERNADRFTDLKKETFDFIGSMSEELTRT